MDEQQVILINNRTIGAGARVFVIAEAGVNHNGDLAKARKMVDVAVEAGADAVKFQSFRAEQLVTASAAKADYQLSGTPRDETQLEMLQRLELTSAAQRELRDYCRDSGTIFLSTPFDEASADLLEELEVPAFKISSGDLTNLPLIDYVARKGRPLILSTGMADIAEVGQAVETARRAGLSDLVLLHCVSNYPADPADVNLRAMKTMTEAFGVPVGYSDHTEKSEIALAAAALGAAVIEKHFTLSRSLPGPDHRASLEPAELKDMISSVRKIEGALGDGRKIPALSESKIALVARRSLTAAADIRAGTRIKSEEIALRRPGSGLKPAQLDSLIGRVARIDIPSGTLLTLEMFE